MAQEQHGAAFWADIGVVADLSPEVLLTFDGIAEIAGAGAWDIIAWKGDCLLFIESKQYGSDKLTLNQRRWLERRSIRAFHLRLSLSSSTTHEGLSIPEGLLQVKEGSAP